MTERLYHGDSYLVDFSARVFAREGDGSRLILDRTAFYPASGGQPCDFGTIEGVQVLNVEEDDEGRIVHSLSAPVAGDTVNCRVDWERRFDHMQQHSGQHLLSAVIVECCGIPTVSFHLGEEFSTIDIATGSLDARVVARIESRANQVIAENRAVTVEYRDPSDQADLRAPSSRQGTLRVVKMEDLDVSACGGTHVHATGEIGCLLVGRLDKMHGNVRIEFVCGSRAVRRARADYDALSRIARTLGTPMAATPDAVTAQQDRLKELEKACRRLAVELAKRRGRELYETAPVTASGLRVHENVIASGSLGDDVRAEAQSFTASPRAVYLAASRDPAAILLAVSADAGLQAGAVLKQALAAAGGRGGGSTGMAQGSVPGAEALDAALAAIRDVVNSVRLT
ncbi:MAG: DHHA1 domain-containing protein [Acidobacteriales bacterium]|nr:DHHA1 domain-containing protein [Terriglobales bacterium]